MIGWIPTGPLARNSGVDVCFFAVSWESDVSICKKMEKGKIFTKMRDEIDTRREVNKTMITTTYRFLYMRLAGSPIILC